MSLYFRDRSVTVSFCPLLSSCFYLFISVFSISLSRLCFPVSAPPPPPTPPYYCMRASDAFSFQILPFVLLTYFLHLWVSLRAFPTLFAPPSLVSPACLKHLSFNYQLSVTLCPSITSVVPHVFGFLD